MNAAMKYAALVNVEKIARALELSLLSRSV